MTAFCDILYQKYLLHTNEKVELSKEYLHTTAYFMSNLNNFKSTTDILMHILGSSLIYQVLHTKTTYKREKFIYLKSILDNPFISSNQKANFLSMFQDIQQINNSFCKLLQKYKWKKSKLANEHDLIMNPINETQYFVCSLLQYGRKYLFTKSDLTKIIENALINSPYIYAEPLPIKNPYNNSIFDKSHLYNIYFFMKHGGFILPSIFHQYFLHNFHLKIFRNNTECMIREMHIKTMTDTNNTSLVRDIKTMLELYNNECYDNNLKFNIHDTFPEDVLIRAMKPLLHIFYTSNYSLCISSKRTAQVELIYQLNKFKRKTPEFGRRIIKFNSANKKCKSPTYITQYTPYINNSYYKNYETSHIEIIEDNTDDEKEDFISLYTTFFTDNNIINTNIDDDSDDEYDEYDELDDTYDD